MNPESIVSWTPEKEELKKNGQVWEGSRVSKAAEWSIKTETKKHSLKTSIGYWWEKS